MSILDSLAAALPDLPTKLAVAARFALDNPERIAMTSMRSVASQCGVASPTMLRLARLMNFDSYEDFKAAFQQQIVGQGFSSRAHELHKGGLDDKGSLVARIAESAVDNVSRTLSGQSPKSDYDPKMLDAVAKVLLGAKTTYVLGAGSMHWVAALMQSTGRMALPSLRVPRSGDALMTETIGALEDKDAVLAFGISPYARATLDALKFARERGAKTIVLTDRRSSPLLEYADYRMLASSRSPHYYPSFVAIVALVEALLATVVVKGGKKTLERIDHVEKLREESGAFIK
ncbi:MAG: MurR/RpiR family transcriptional regulator [Pseudomonadota bacterium]